MLILAAVILFTPLYYGWTSRFNQFFFFGRTVAAGTAQSPAGRAITRRFRLQLWLGVIPAFAAALAFGLHGGRMTLLRATPAAYLAGLLVETAVFYLAFASANRAAAAFAEREASSPVVEVPLKAANAIPSLRTHLAPFLAAAGISLAGWAAMARHAGWGGAASALDTVVGAHGAEGLMSMGMGMVVGCMASLGIRNTARTRTALGQSSLRASIVGGWAGFVCIAIAFAVTYFGLYLSHAVAKGILYGLLAFAAGTILWRTWRSRTYVPPAAEWTSDEKWRWGMFYHNAADPALFVQCRFGPGYTLNFGRMMAWPIYAGFWAFLVGVLMLTGHR